MVQRMRLRKIFHKKWLTEYIHKNDSLTKKIHKNHLQNENETHKNVSQKHSQKRLTNKTHKNVSQKETHKNIHKNDSQNETHINVSRYS